MKKSLGAIISAVGALLAILGMFLPFVKIEFLGMSESWNLFTERFYVFGLITMLVAVAGAVLSFIKKYLPGAILTAVGGILMVIVFLSNNKEVGELGGFGSKGIGWVFCLLSFIVLIAGAVITFIGKEN